MGLGVGDCEYGGAAVGAAVQPVSKEPAVGRLAAKSCVCRYVKAEGGSAEE